MGLGHTVSDTLGLIKHTFTVIGKNKDILKPTWAQAKFALFFYLALLTGIALVFFTMQGLIGILLIVTSIIALVLYFPFYQVAKKAAQVWLVHQTFTGKPCSYEEGKERAKKNKGDIFVLGLLNIILGFISKKLKEGSGKQGLAGVLITILKWTIGKTIEEGWDLISNFLLPAAIIKEQSVRQALPELQGIKNNIPATLTGVLGIDFAGDIALRILNIINFLLIIGGVAIGILTSTWIPLLIIIVLVIAFNVVAKIFVDMLKTIYFTLFYIAAQLPDKVPKEYQEEILHYLQSAKKETSTGQAQPQSI